MEADHIKPWRAGGKTDAANCQLLCRGDNRRKGVILGGQLVCPGHQWTFDLNTGWESVEEQGLPMYDTRVVDGMVQVSLTSVRVATSA